MSSLYKFLTIGVISSFQEPLSDVPYTFLSIRSVLRFPLFFQTETTMRKTEVQLLPLHEQ